VRLLIFSASTVHRPAAYVNRCLSLAKGLAGGGHTVQIMCLEPSGAEPEEGTIEGIPYMHMASGGQRRADRFRSLMGQTARAAEHAVRALQPDAALLLQQRTWQLEPLQHVLRRRRLPSVQEYNEYPHAVVRNRAESLLVEYFLRVQARRFAGMALMTRRLEAFFLGRVRGCPPTVVIPMTVENERFADPGSRPFPFPYVAYCGKLVDDKDGVPILIDAFSRIASEFPDLRLVLVGGDRDAATRQALERAVAGRCDGNRVVLTGRLSRQMVPAYLSHAQVLALARPRSRQAEYGFPTKLGEYLASGRPVAVTAVGEIPEYLRDGDNARLARPNDAGDFARVLRELLLAPEVAAEIGRRGRQVARGVFDSHVQGQRLGEFIGLVSAFPR